MGEGVSEPEDGAVEITQSEEQRAGQWDGNGRSNFCVIRNPEETIGETGVAERISEAGLNPKQNISKMSTPRLIISKLKTKKKVMKGASQGVKNHPNDSRFLITNYGDREKLA